MANASPESATYRWYVVGVLMACYALSFIDRQVLSLLVEPIKQDLVLSDTQFSILQGFAFAIFYTFVGLFMGRLADTKNRRMIIVAGVAAWSLMTALCGVAKNFAHLFLARVGVGVGEATLTPAALSIIGDYFKPNELGRAMSFYKVGIYIGAGLAFVIGGTLLASLPEVATWPIVGEIKTWQILFLVIGLSGLPFALLVLTIREPKRGRYAESESGEISSVAETLRFFAKHKEFYLYHFFGFSMLTAIGYGFQSWVPAYLIRMHGWEASEIGIVYGAINLLAAPIGVVCGGLLGDYLARHGYKDAYLRSAVIGSWFLWIPAAIATLSDSAMISLSILAILHFFASFHGGVAVAALHIVSPLRMRAQAVAGYLFVINIVGLGMGPLSIALLTDYVFQSEQKVGTSLALFGLLVMPMAIGLLTLSMRHYRRMLT